MSQTLNKFEEYYNNSTLLGCAILAFVYLIFSAIAPELAVNFIKYIIPLFICILCIEIYIIKSKIQKISIGVNDQIVPFKFGDDLDKYLDKRFNEVKDVKTILASANGIQSDPEPNKKNYIKSLHRYMGSGRTFSRVFAANSNIKLYKDIRDEMVKFADKRHFIFYNDKVDVIAGRYQFILILDNSEICFGGGYNTPYEVNSISIKNDIIVKWYVDYYHSLVNQSVSLRKEDNTINLKLLDSIIEKRFGNAV